VSPEEKGFASLWHQTAVEVAPPSVDFAQLRDARPDAIVVGAGVLGLSTALHLAERGARVFVLEREAPGRGTTGCSNGQVIAGLQEPPDALLAAYGEHWGERIVGFSGQAPERLFELVRRHGIACEAERNGWLQATRSAHGMKKLARVVDSWSRRGAPVRLLDAAQTARALGSQAYAGGLFDERNGSIQPYAYALGLARAASSAGVSICYPVGVQDVARTADGWRVHTDRGTLLAPAVVLATNVRTRELQGIAHDFLGRSFLSGFSVQLATEPLNAAQLAEVLPRRIAASNTSHLRLRYCRLDAGGRFVIGGPGWFTPPRSPSAPSLQILESSMRRLFPALADVAVDFRWAARDTGTLDLLPHLYEPQPGLFSALGFNGRGLAIGTALGSVLADRVGGAPADAQPFPMTQASPVPLNPVATLGFYAKLAWAHLRRK
jgi:glycine/D-amino acid oxidase-like deaminating enzyme